MFTAEFEKTAVSRRMIANAIASVGVDRARPHMAPKGKLSLKSSVARDIMFRKGFQDTKTLSAPLKLGSPERAAEKKFIKDMRKEHLPKNKPISSEFRDLLWKIDEKSRGI